MNIEPGLHQKLLELHYDLLPEAEAADLRRRIESESSLADAYASVRRQAELFGDAARLETPKVRLKRPDSAAGEKSHSVTSRTLDPDRRPSASARVASWIIGLAAAALLALSAGGYWHHQAQLSAIAQRHLRLLVSGPATLEPGATHHFSVLTTTATGDALSATVDYTLYSPEDETLFSAQMPTDDRGRLTLDIPAEVDVAHGGRLEVEARHGEARQRIEPLRLAAERRRYVTRLSLDKPLYRPGETIYYRSLTLDRFNLAAESEMLVHFEIHDPSGAVVPGSPAEGATQNGVGSGAFSIPPELPGGPYTLIARSLNQAFPEEKREFFIRQYRTPRFKKLLEFVRDSYSPGDEVVADFSAETAQGDPLAAVALQLVATVDGAEVWRTDAVATATGTYRAEFTLPERMQRGDGQLVVVVDDGGGRETIAKSIPISLGKVKVQLFPEGGDLVAGLENRVYFSARDPQGEPVHLTGHVVDSRGEQVAEVETVYEGMGSFVFRPVADESYKLEIVSPPGITSIPRLPPPATDRPVVLSLRRGVIAAGEPLVVNVRSATNDLPLVVVVTCRGVPVGQFPLDAVPGENEIKIPLSDELGGVLRVTVYDYRAPTPRPIAERLAYRRLERRLNVDVVDAQPRYSPGDPVRLSLRVTDEQGAAASATLGVAVVDDALLNLADDKTAGMRTHFLLTTEVADPSDLEDADFYLSNDPQAEASLDLLLGTQGWRRFVEQTIEETPENEPEDEQLARLMAIDGVTRPPAVWDNLDQVRQDYRQSAASFSAQRAAMLGGLSVVASVAMLLLLLLTVLMRLLRSVELGLPALAAAVASLLLGVWLLGADDPVSLTSGPVAYNPYRVDPPDQTSPRQSGANQRPVSRYEMLFYGDRPEPMAELGDRLLAGEVADEIRNWEFDGELADGRDFGAMQMADKLGLRLLAAEGLGGNEQVGEQLRQWFDDGARKRLLEADRFGRILDRRLVGDFAKRRAERRFDADFYYANDARLGAGFESDDVAAYRFSVRQYAHVHTSRGDGIRNDFTETLYWHPGLSTDSDGLTTIEFQLSDSITTFRVSADAHGNGRIGSGGGEIVSRLPFNLSPKLPLAVTAGDRIDVPLAVVNETDSELPLQLTLEHDQLLRYEGPTDGPLRLAAGRRARHYYALDVIGHNGQAELTFRGAVPGDGLSDAVQRSVRVVPRGFPIHLSYGGQIEGPQEVVVRLPDDWVPGSLEVSLDAFPSTLADLQNGLEGIMQEPNGCFEQASTSNYPNVLALKYMQEHDVADPEITKRAKSLLASGYGRLTGYECPQKGYEWFGGDPGHEALSAYGLMQFRDMAAVYDVDPEMVRRTADWLLARRDGQGGFKRNAKALDSFGGAPAEVTNAYITWALSESGQSGIDAEIEHVKLLGRSTDDPYVLALAAASLVNAGQRDAGLELLKKLSDSQDQDGSLTGTQGSITRSGGISLAVETTALAALAWLKEPEFREPAERAVRWITANRQGSGGFGSTQATILALKALVTHARVSRGTVVGGELIVQRDGLAIANHRFGAGEHQTISIDGLAAKLEPGENRLAIELTGDNQMPYALNVSYRSQTPASDDACPLRLSTKLAAAKVTSGETVRLSARLTNSTDTGQPMSIAIIGLPAGLEPRGDQLEEMKKAGKFDYYETREREIICYWRSMAPNRNVSLDFDLVAEIPGRYTAPASRAYLYYTAEQKQWVEPLSVEITRP